MSFYIGKEKLYFNGFEIICNIKTPFHSVMNNSLMRYSKKELFKTKSESLTSKRMRRYFLHIKDQEYAKFYTVYYKSLKSNAIYKTSSKTSKLLKCFAINLIYRQPVTNTVTRSIKKIIKNLIFKIKQQDDAKIIISDFLQYKQDFKLTNTEGVLDQKIKKFLDVLLNEYGSIPLNILNKEILEVISAKNTNIDVTWYKNKKILVISLQNPYYAGFISRELYNHAAKIIPFAVFTHT
jgi:Zn-finger protein